MMSISSKKWDHYRHRLPLSGMTWASNEQSKPFLEGITNPDFQFVQKVQPRGLDGKMFQYAGVAPY